MTRAASADNLLALVKLGTKVNTLERCRVLAEAKQVYITLHPETRQGKAGGFARQGRMAAAQSFTRYAAGLTGRSPRSIELAVAVWNGLSPDSRDRLSGLAIADNQRELQALSRLPPDPQRAALDRLLAGEITSFTGPLGKSLRPVPPDLTAVSRRDLIAELWRRETSNG